jgi:trimeric autotransporter adhesin
LKKSLLALSIFIFYNLLNAQSWQPVGNGVKGYVNTLFVYDSVLYAGGLFDSPGNNITQWNGSTWGSLSSGVNNQVYAIGRFHQLIYVGGWFSQAGGQSAGSIATWNGNSFANAGFDVEGGRVDVIQTYDSLLYIGGQFDSVNHNRPSGLVTWDGKKVDSLDISFGGDWDNVFALDTYKDLMVIGFASAENGQWAVSWNNISAQPLGDYYFYPALYNGLSFNTYCQADTNLYLGGSFLYCTYNYGSSTKDTLNNIAMWNGSKWTKVGKGINGTVNALVYYNNLLVAAGSFTSAGDTPANNIAAWNGTSWSALGNGINGTVYSLAIFNNNLYAGGGDFTSPGNGIAEYAIPNNSISDSINVFPNPNNGNFTVVCNKTSITSSEPTLEIFNIRVYTD